jgi:hypothetical protein
MTEEEFCRLLNIGLRSLRRWEASGDDPRGTASQVCAGLEEAVRRHPGEAIVRYIRGASAVGGISYLIVKLLDHWAAFGALEQPRFRK